jgi:hypothetical protein
MKFLPVLASLAVSVAAAGIYGGDANGNPWCDHGSPGNGECEKRHLNTFCVSQCKRRIRQELLAAWSHTAIVECCHSFGFEANWGYSASALTGNRLVNSWFHESFMVKPRIFKGVTLVVWRLQDGCIVRR